MCDVLVATGEMFHEAIDLDLPGNPPFEFKRSYSTTASTIGPLGLGWQHNWHIEMVLEGETVRIDKGSEGSETYQRDQCDGTRGPLVHIHDGRFIAELLYPLKRRLIFLRDQTTAGKWLLAEGHDAYNNWTRYRYEQGRLVEVTDREGRHVQFRYNMSNLLATIHVKLRHLEQTIHYRYDGQQRLVEIVDPLGHVQRFEYARHLIVRHVDKVGIQRFFCYDNRYRCIGDWFEDGFELRRLDHSPDNRLALVTNSLGCRYLYRLNEMGLVEKTVDPLGRVMEWIYDDKGGQLCELLPNGMPYQMTTWDPVKRVRTICDVRGMTTIFEADELGNTLSITNACGDVLRFVYDDRGEIVEVIEPGGLRWRYEYDDRGRLSRLIDPKGEWVRTTYKDQEIIIEDLVGLSGCYRFDDLGNLLSFADALGRVTSFEYDGQDRLVRMVEPDRRVTRWELDAIDRPVSVTDPIGRKTQFEYDVLSSLSIVHYADGTQVCYESNREGDPIRVINQKGEATVYEYDTAGRLLRVTYFDGRQETFEYDVLDRIVAQTDAIGRTTFSYDEAMNPIEIHWPDGSVQTNTYDEMERLASMLLEPPPGVSGPTHETSFEYDPRDHVVSETNEGFTVNYGLDASGYPNVYRDSLGRELHYQVDSRSRITRIDDGPYIYEFEYNMADELETLVLPNGMLQRLYFDAGSRLVRREVVSRTGTILAWRDFRYDAADQMLEMVDWRLGRFEYRYDLVGRLTHVIDSSGTTVERYAYDPAGNLLSSPLYSSFGMDRGNRLRQSDQVQYTYDGAGRLISLDDGQQRWQYAYGYLDQLDRVLRDGQVVAEYEYDLCGRRTYKRVDDEEIHFYYHINNLMTFHSSQDGRWDIIHVPETMVPLAMVHDGKLFFISFDQIGTPTEIWAEDESLVAVISSQTYGTNRDIEWLSGLPMRFPFHFEGQFCDEETGLHYNRFRYYSPLTARFITQDPLGFDGDLNLYIYPPNPITWIDPLGLACPKPIELRCGTRKKKYSPCEAKAAMAKVNRMNKGKRRRCEKASQCRSGQQKQYYEKNCSGPAVKQGFDVDHSKEIQQGGSDLCCKNLMPIPARPNRSLGGQIKNRKLCAGPGELLPKFKLGSPCTSPSYINKCQTDFKPGRKKPSAAPENCKDVRSKKECI